MKQTAIVIIISLFLSCQTNTILALNQASACRCDDLGNLFIREYLSYSNIVIAKINKVVIKEHIKIVHATVQNVFKGNLTVGDSVRIETRIVGCGANITEGAFWVLFHVNSIISKCSRDFAIRKPNSEQLIDKTGLEVYIKESKLSNTLDKYKQLTMQDGYVKTREEEGSIIDGKKEGLWTVYEVAAYPPCYRSDEKSERYPLETMSYSSGKLDGTYVAYLCNRPIGIWNYRMGEKKGWQIDYYGNGKKRTEHFINDEGEVIEKLQYNAKGERTFSWTKGANK